MEQTKRQRQAARLLHEHLEYVLHKMRPFAGCGALVSVESIHMTGDLAEARVLLSIYPTEHTQTAWQKLGEHEYAINRQLVQRIRGKFRKMPRIVFYSDDRFAQADRMYHLIDQANQPHS